MASNRTRTRTGTPVVPGQRSGTASTVGNKGGSHHQDAQVCVHVTRHRKAPSPVGRGSTCQMSRTRKARPFSHRYPSGAGAGHATPGCLSDVKGGRTSAGTGSS